MVDRLEGLRHELADVEQAIADAEEAPQPLLDREDELRVEILKLERAAREEAGAQPEPVDASVEEIAESRPAATDLVVPPSIGADQRYETVLVLDKHDEDQILATIEERMDAVLLYDFPQGGSRLIDLSYNGVMECVRQINQTGRARVGIVEGSLTITMEQGEEGVEYVAQVAARDELTGLLIYATAAEPQMMKSHGKLKFDKFARQKAVSKAQRNALKQHIPERIRQGLIAMYKGDAARVLEVKHGAGAAAAAQLPPPVDSPRAKELEGECQRLWTTIRGLPDWRAFMLPGVYNQKLSRARSSEAELEAFRDALESLRAKLAGEVE